MRIAFVIGTLDLGGTESQMCRLAGELSARGHDVRVFVLEGRGPLADVLEASGIPWEGFGYLGLSIRDERRRLRPWKGLPALLRILGLWRSMRRFRPDVCHAFLLSAYVYGMIGASLIRIPVRVSSRRGPMGKIRESPVLWEAGVFSNRFAHVIVANSDAGKLEAIRDEGVKPDRIRMIRNGVDIPRNAANIALQPPSGLLISNFKTYKGHVDLVAALSRLKDVPLVRLAGEGPERAVIERAIEAAGLTERIILEGRVLEARTLYGQVQFGLLVSHQEGLPNAVMEGMAAGVPMIATAVGGVIEIIEDGVDGLLVPPQDPAALARAIERLCADPSLRISLGTAARRKAASWSWEQCTTAHLDLYREFGVSE